MKAADVMVANVITVPVEASIGEVAEMLLNHHISGAPVVGGNGELVGIVSEGDLMRRPETGTARRPSWWLALLASAAKKLPPMASVGDSELRNDIVERLSAEPWRPTMLTVTVQDGAVDLWGIVHSPDQKKAARLAVELTPGVRSVTDNIIIRPAASGSWETAARLRRSGSPKEASPE